jgi:heme/copper-type cytochrome/quinol oxidase subunit 2
MDSFEEQEGKSKLSAILIIAFIFALGASSWGVYCIVAKFSFFADASNNQVNYYHDNQFFGQVFTSIAYNIVIITIIMRLKY